MSEDVVLEEQEVIDLDVKSEDVIEVVPLIDSVSFEDLEVEGEVVSKEGFFKKAMKFIMKWGGSVYKYTPGFVKTALKSKIVRKTLNLKPVRWTGKIVKGVGSGVLKALGPFATSTWWGTLGREFINISFRRVFESFAVVLKHSIYKDGGNDLENKIKEEQHKTSPANAFSGNNSSSYGRNSSVFNAPSYPNYGGSGQGMFDGFGG